MRVVYERVTTGAAAAVPVPVSAIDCGEPATLSVMDREALRVPAAVGLKVMPMAQLPPAATAVVQVLEATVKSPAFVPLTATVETVKGAVPVFFIVNVWAGLAVPTFSLGKDRVENETAGAMPVPLSVSDGGEPAALSVSEAEAERVPVAVGLKAMPTVQLADGARDKLVQVVVLITKSAAAVPVKE